MNISTDNELRKHQLEAVAALEEVDRIFRENNINYYLLAGSALGAVRHKGFIPWDDDIDIGILWEDKDRAYQALKNISAPYEWLNRNIDKTFPRFYGKVLKDKRGLVDVFVLVKTSENSLKRKMQWIIKSIFFKLYKNKLSYTTPSEMHDIKRRIRRIMAGFIAPFISIDAIEKVIAHNEAKFEKSSAKYYLNIYSFYGSDKEVIKKDWLFPAGRVSFEGKEYPTVNDTDAYLTHLYGDYMTPPPEGDRTPTHEELFL